MHFLQMFNILDALSIFGISTNKMGMPELVNS